MTSQFRKVTVGIEDSEETWGKGKERIRGRRYGDRWRCRKGERRVGGMERQEFSGRADEGSREAQLPRLGKSPGQFGSLSKLSLHAGCPRLANCITLFEILSSSSAIQSSSSVLLGLTVVSSFMMKLRSKLYDSEFSLYILLLYLSCFLT